jgi:hypothetical protein
MRAIPAHPADQGSITMEGADVGDTGASHVSLGIAHVPENCRRFRGFGRRQSEWARSAGRLRKYVRAAGTRPRSLSAHEGALPSARRHRRPREQRMCAIGRALMSTRSCCC